MNQSATCSHKQTQSLCLSHCLQFSMLFKQHGYYSDPTRPQATPLPFGKFKCHFFLIFFFHSDINYKNHQRYLQHREISSIKNKDCDFLFINVLYISDCERTTVPPNCTKSAICNAQAKFSLFPFKSPNNLEKNISWLCTLN